MYLTTSTTQLLYLLLLLFAAAVASSCTGLKAVPEGDHLYTGASLDYVYEEKVPEKREINEELTLLLKPSPNLTIFGFMRPRLWLYNVAGKTDSQKGIKGFIKYKLGEPPVLLSQVDSLNTAHLLENRLENSGFFNAEAVPEIDRKKKTASVEYKLLLQEPYVLQNITFPKPGPPVETVIYDAKETSLLKEGDLYNLGRLVAERARLDDALDNKGYYYFSPTFLQFKADTTVGDHKVDLVLELKPTIPDRAMKAWRMDSVYVFPDYSIEKREEIIASDTVVFDSIHYVARTNRFRSTPILRNVLLRPGNLFSRKQYNGTIRRLNDLGVYQFVKFDIEASQDSASLIGHVYMTPRQRFNARAQVGAVTKSNNFAGSEAQINFQDRNIFRGAEQLTISLNGGFESQIAQQEGVDGISYYELGINAALAVPRLITPFRFPGQAKRFYNTTTFAVGAELLNFRELFSMSSVKTSVGYSWRETSTRQHNLIPFNVDYINLLEGDSTFQEQIERNLFLRGVFADQFILGSIYNFTYNNSTKERKKNYFYFNGNVDVSGNLFFGAFSLLSSDEGNSDNPFTVLNRPFSQYARFTTDTRHYRDVTASMKLAMRFIAGVGVPYGNSRSLPFVKQYFIGGTNSIRAFRARNLGPGTYNPLNEDGNSFQFRRNGDIKLEANLELRQQLTGFFNGAFFIDVGNVWLVNEDPERPGGVFKPDSFYQELAIGTGLGLRIDVEFFVLRLDFGVPVRIPGLEGSDQWVITEFNPLSSDWRKERLVLNIAIGYPF